MSPMRRIIFSGHKDSESGNSAVEFAFVGMILIAGTIGALELGRIAYTYHNLLGAVGTTTRLVEMQATDDAILNSVVSYFSAGSPEALTVSITTDTVDDVVYKQVQAQYELPLLVPGLGIFPGNIYIVRASQRVPLS